VSSTARRRPGPCRVPAVLALCRRKLPLLPLNVDTLLVFVYTKMSKGELAFDRADQVREDTKSTQQGGAEAANFNKQLKFARLVPSDDMCCTVLVATTENDANGESLADHWVTFRLKGWKKMLPMEQALERLDNGTRTEERWQRFYDDFVYNDPEEPRTRTTGIFMAPDDDRVSELVENENWLYNAVVDERRKRNLEIVFYRKKTGKSTTPLKPRPLDGHCKLTLSKNTMRLQISPTDTITAYVVCTYGKLPRNVSPFCPGKLPLLYVHFFEVAVHCRNTNLGSLMMTALLEGCRPCHVSCVVPRRNQPSARVLGRDVGVHRGQRRRRILRTCVRRGRGTKARGVVISSILSHVNEQPRRRAETALPVKGSSATKTLRP
jgi:hypothetical protein